MSASVAVLIGWLLFGGTHLFLSWPPVRQRLANRFGAARFVAIYAIAAAVSLTLLALIVARYGDQGPRGISLASIPIMKWILGAISLSGAALAVAGMVNYPRSAMAVLARRMRSSGEAKRAPLAAPSMIERITRHPFFVGLALLMAAHTLMAKTLPGAIFFAGFTLLVLIGIPMQDRKLRERHGPTYGDYEDATSAVPFANPQLEPGENSQRILPVLGTAIVGAVIVAALHPVWRLDHGAWFVILVAIGGSFGVIRQLMSNQNT